MKAATNKLGITDRREIEKAEADAIKAALIKLRGLYHADHRFTSPDIISIHKTWLGDIYSWAGEYRLTDLGMKDISFAVPKQIPNLMRAFENGPLRRHTPCIFKSADRVVRALSEVFTELVLISPFSEGNGGTARVLASLMANQAGLPLLDFRDMEGMKNEDYYLAIRGGLNGDYKPMEELFSRIVLRSVKARSRRT